MIRSWSRSSALVLALVAGACSSLGHDGSPVPAASPAGFRGKTTERPTAELEGQRKPDGVAVDPATLVPRAEGAANAGSDPLVALVPPFGDNVGRALLTAFFRAVVNEDTETLSDLLSAGATTIATARGPAPSALDHWRLRLRRGQYRKLANEIVYQDADVETY